MAKKTVSTAPKTTSVKVDYYPNRMTVGIAVLSVVILVGIALLIALSYR